MTIVSVRADDLQLGDVIHFRIGSADRSFRVVDVQIWSGQRTANVVIGMGSITHPEIDPIYATARPWRRYRVERVGPR